MDLLIEKQTFGNLHEFYLEITEIGDEAYYTFLKAQLINQIDAIDDKLET